MGEYHERVLSTELKTVFGHRKEFKADVSSASPSSEGLELTLEMSAFKLFMLSNLRKKLS